MRGQFSSQGPARGKLPLQRAEAMALGTGPNRQGIENEGMEAPPGLGAPGTPRASSEPGAARQWALCLDSSPTRLGPCLPPTGALELCGPEPGVLRSPIQRVQKFAQVREARLGVRGFSSNPMTKSNLRGL